MPHNHGKFRVVGLEEGVPLARLVKDGDNANRHDEDNLAHITRSFEAFGQVDPLVARKCDRVVFGGNGRVEAMERLGWEKADRVLWIEGSDKECRGYAIAANRTARTSYFDDSLLADQLADLKDAGLLAAATYSPEEYATLLQEVDAPDFKDFSGELPVTPAEDPPKHRCKACGAAFDPKCPGCGFAGSSVEGREHRARKRAAKPAKKTKAANP